MELSELRSLAAKEELSLNYIAKDEMISRVLFAVQGNDDIILKGGTAINRVYLKNMRFSEDIDLDLVFKENVKKAIKRANEIAAKIKGFQVEKPRIMKETIRYDLFYINPLAHKDKIRLEFRIVKKASGYEKRVVNFGFVPSESSLLNVYDIDKLIKHKIECITDRTEGKDFFDLYYLLDLPHTQIKESNKIIQKLNLEQKEITAVANIINHYIPRKRRPEWNIFIENLKNKLVKENS
jgi:predicted nucleotidyltransferase component of viral defense system